MASLGPHPSEAPDSPRASAARSKQGLAEWAGSEHGPAAAELSGRNGLFWKEHRNLGGNQVGGRNSRLGGPTHSISSSLFAHLFCHKNAEEPPERGPEGLRQGPVPSPVCLPAPGEQTVTPVLRRSREANHCWHRSPRPHFTTPSCIVYVWIF